MRLYNLVGKVKKNKPTTLPSYDVLEKEETKEEYLGNWGRQCKVVKMKSSWWKVVPHHIVALLLRRTGSS